MRRLLHRSVVALLAVTTATAGAATLNVVGIFPGKAVVAVDKAPPRSVSVGDTIEGFKLVSVGTDGATFVVDGHRQTIPMGSYLAGTSGHGRPTAVLGPDGRGHFFTQGTVNSGSTRFLVDTGATLVVLSAAEAERLGVSYKLAPQSVTNTANGPVALRLVKLDRIKVGDVELNNVDAGVLESGYSGPALLGMSFLSRTEVTRDGQSMVLTRRY